MTSFYDILDKLKTYLQGNTNVNTVTFGDIFEVDLAKQTIFPLSHIIVNSCTFQDHVVQFNLQIICMDIVNEKKEDKKDLNNYFHDINNKQDILNTQLALATRVMRVLQKSDLYRDKFEVIDTASCEPFTERFDNMLAGWAVTFNAGTKDEMTYC